VDDLSNYADHFGVSMVAEWILVPSGISTQEDRLFAWLVRPRCVGMFFDVVERFWHQMA